MGTSKNYGHILAPNFNLKGGRILTTEVTLTATQAKALRATPQSIAPAPGAGKVAYPLHGIIAMDYAAAFTETAENLVLKWTNGSGAAASQVVETTGFLDATSDQIRPILPTNDAAGVANAALVLHNNGDGELGGTGSPLKIKLTYIVFETGL